MDDVGDFQRLVEQRDVAVSEVDRGTGCRREVVVGTDGGGDDEIVDDFTIDFRYHFVCHEVGQGAFGVDVMDGLKVLSGFKRPARLELADDGTDRVTVDAHRDFRLERVSFEIVLVVNARHGTGRERSGRQLDLDCSGGRAEGSGTQRRRIDGERRREIGAITDDHAVGVTRGVERDAQARRRVIAVRGCCGGRFEHFHHHRAGEDRAMGERGAHGVATGDRGRFTLDFLRGVVRIKSPAVLAREALAGVLAHDLGTGDRLALGEGVAIADVENQAGRLAHRLDADEVIGDQLRIRLADERQGESGEVGDVGRRRLVFEEDRAVFRIPVLVLVFHEGGEQRELLLGNFPELAENRSPLLNEGVALGFGHQIGVVDVHVAASTRIAAFDEVATGTVAIR